MSKETAEWLNTRTLIGYTSKRGNAWHYREDEQGAEPNHYDTDIPVEDVRRRLFAWAAAEGDLTTTYLTEDGVNTLTDGTRKAIVRPAGTFGPDDPGAVLGVFKNGYTVHQYDEWLISNVSTLLDADLKIGSAGLLKGGAVAWVQVELDDTLEVCGVQHRPFVTAATSMDGSLATTYQRGTQVVVCDNTLSAALDADDPTVKVRHSRKSLTRIAEIRDALEIVHVIGEDFARQVERLTNTAVTDAQWAAFLDAHTPLSDPKTGEQKTGRGLTMAQTTRGKLSGLYFTDPRVAPWKGSAYGVLAAVNTYTHHEQNVRGGTRLERNMLRMATGEHDTLDAQTLATLNRVLIPA